MLPFGGGHRLRHGLRGVEIGAIEMNETVRKISGASCPLCGKPSDQAIKPFCSKRCADIDLNRWLSGVYAVPAKEEEDEDGERIKHDGADEKP